jgi:hypothetical protein
MPHPEHALEAMLFGADGRKIFESIIAFQSVPEHRGQMRAGAK